MMMYSVKLKKSTCIIVLCTIMVCASSSSITKAEIPINTSMEVISTLSKVGEGKLTWWGFSVYTAQLYTQSGLWNGFNEPMLLKLRYHRNIDKDDLIERTFKEWRRLPYFDENTMNNWLKLLDKIWRDVKKEDELACYIDSKGATRFYDQHELLGTIEDPRFGYTFLAIWLAETTSEPEIRKKLLSVHH